MTVGNQRPARGPGGAHRAARHRGFTDLEELGRQARPELYRLCAGHPPPLVPAELRVAVPGRTGPDGVLRALDEEALGTALAELDCEAVAVCLLWGFRHPGHERRVAELGGRGARRSTRLDFARDRRRLPRVRALRDDDRGRRPVAAAARLPGATHRARRRRRPARARGDAVERRHRSRLHGGAAWVLDRLVGGRPAAPSGRLGWPAATRSGSTWAARPATCRCCAAAPPPSGAAAAWGPRARAADGGPSTPSAPAAARSRGATRAARCAWGRAPRAPIRAGLLRPRRDRADRYRRRPAAGLARRAVAARGRRAARP